MQAVGARKNDIAEVQRGAPQTGHWHFLQWRAALFTADRMHWLERAQAEAETGHTEIALDGLLVLCAIAGAGIDCAFELLVERLS